jgi:hypothetical protein
VRLAGRVLGVRRVTGCYSRQGDLKLPNLGAVFMAEAYVNE